MKTLQEHNAEMRARYEKAEIERRKGKRNGIACPKCGAELFDTHPNLTLTSYPPQKNTDCRADGCDYTGYRIC